MKILITAGSTRTMIDKVRCISNVFKGRTGHNIAEYMQVKENQVTIITSGDFVLPKNIIKIKYKTYDELYSNMEREIKTGNYDVIIHSAAVSDYKVDGIYLPSEFGKKFIPVANLSKVSSEHETMSLRLSKTEKIVDKIRKEWNFKGVLVKFKLQVDMDDDELIRIATESMIHSGADIMVANCLEWSKNRAYVINGSGNKVLVESVDRDVLSVKLLDAISGKYNDRVVDNFFGDVNLEEVVEYLESKGCEFEKIKE